MTITAAADWSPFDRHMMSIALRMAERGLGTTAFNPSVGAVIADEDTGEVIARGWTQPSGRPHAEKEALRRAGARAVGKTMYVTLEPCAHTGRLPTCADAVASAGLKRLVCAVADPNPGIAGRGLDQLRAAGVQVDVGLMEQDARIVIRGHIAHIASGRPFVQLKLAVSADWLLAPGKNGPVWVTGPEARTVGHLMRAKTDVIVTGISTVITDDPQLTCRLPGMAERSPHRLIADTHLRMPETARVLGRPDIEQKVWIAASDRVAASDYARQLIAEQRITGIINVGKLALQVAPIFAALAKEPVRRLMVEGGPRLSRSFIEHDVVDEVVLFRGTTTLGSNSLEPLAGLPFPATLDDKQRWSCTDRRPVGLDEMIVYRRNRR